VRFVIKSAVTKGVNLMATRKSWGWNSEQEVTGIWMIDKSFKISREEKNLVSQHHLRDLLAEEGPEGVLSLSL